MIAVSSFIGFTGLVAFIAWHKTRHDRMVDSDAYFLAGRSLTAWVIAGSLLMTNLSTEHLIGLNADAFRHTIAVMAWETTAAIAMVLTALYFLPRYLKSGLTTIPDFLALRFDAGTRFIASILFLFSYALAILPVCLLFGAIALESLFDVSATFGISRTNAVILMVWGIGTLGSLYAVFGGLKAVAISDAVNGVGFLIAGLMIPVLALIYVGDGDLLGGLSHVYEEEYEKFDITGDEPGSFLPFGVLFTGMIVNQIFFWCTNQSIIQRSLGAKNLAEGQKGILIAAVFKLLGPLIIVLPGVIAFHLFKDVIGPEDYLMAYPTLVKTVLPTPLVGFFAAVMVGAVLSTFNSVLNSAATLFTRGIFDHIRKRPAKDREIVVTGRICSIALALAAMTAAPFIDTSGSLFNYLQIINATFFGPMLAVILLGMMVPFVSSQAAKIGLIGGPVLFYLLVFGFGDQTQALLRSVFDLQYDVHFLHFLAFVFVTTVLVMLTISYFRPAPRRYVQEYTRAVDITPWPHARLAGLVISGIAVLTYVLLAQ